MFQQAFQQPIQGCLLQHSDDKKNVNLSTARKTQKRKNDGGWGTLERAPHKTENLIIIRSNIQSNN